MSLQSSLIGGSDQYVAQSYYPMAGLKHAVQTMIFYREAGQVTIRILPKDVPQAAEYRIFYLTAEANTDTEGNSFILPQGVPLLCVTAALYLLPLTRWPGFTAEQNSTARKEFAAALADQKAAQEREWRKAIATDRKAGLTILRGFDDSSYAQDTGYY
jgi:hypothetical protein